MIDGRRHDHVLPMYWVPNVVHDAMMLPEYQREL